MGKDAVPDAITALGLVKGPLSLLGVIAKSNNKCYSFVTSESAATRSYLGKKNVTQSVSQSLDGS